MCIDASGWKTGTCACDNVIDVSFSRPIIIYSGLYFSSPESALQAVLRDIGLYAGKDKREAVEAELTRLQQEIESLKAQLASTG